MRNRRTLGWNHGHVPAVTALASALFLSFGLRRNSTLAATLGRDLTLTSRMALEEWVAHEVNEFLLGAETRVKVVNTLADRLEKALQAHGGNHEH